MGFIIKTFFAYSLLCDDLVMFLLLCVLDIASIDFKENTVTFVFHGAVFAALAASW